MDNECVENEYQDVLDVILDILETNKEESALLYDGVKKKIEEFKKQQNH